MCPASTQGSIDEERKENGYWQVQYLCQILDWKDSFWWDLIKQKQVLGNRLEFPTFLFAFPFVYMFLYQIQELYEQ